MKKNERFQASDEGGQFKQIGIARLTKKDGQKKTLLIYQNHRGLVLMGVSISPPFRDKGEILSFLKKNGGGGEIEINGEKTKF